MQHPGPIEMLPRRARFADAPRGKGDSGFLYAAEFANGFVKVGRSGNPRTRLESLNQAAKRHFATRVVRFRVSVDVGHLGMYVKERLLLARVFASGAKATTMGECFSELAFDTATSFLDAATKPQPKRIKAPKA